MHISFRKTAAQSAGPDGGGAEADRGGQGPGPPLTSGPRRALPAHLGGNPTSDLQAAAVGLRSGLRFPGAGK